MPTIINDTSVLQALEDGTFAVLQPSSPSAQDFLSGTPIESTQPWDDFLEAFNFVIGQNIEQPIKQLETLRFIRRDTDEAILRQTCSLIGFDISSDIYALSKSDILRIVSQLPMYAENAANTNFSKFLDFVLDSKTNVQYLWTQDYKEFYALPQGLKLEDGGTWFKTTHVDLEIEMLATQEVIDAAFANSDKTVAQRIKEIFYEFAPITLVINRIFTVNSFELTLGFSAELLSYIHEDIVV